MKQTSLVATAAMVLAGCSTYDGATRSNEYTPASNPAAVYCVQQGGELKRVTENGERMTYCQLSEEQRIEQWEYYRSNHKE